MGYPWLWADRSSYHDAGLNAEGRWPHFLYAFMGVFGTNQEPSHAPPHWVAEAGSYSLLGDYMPVPVSFLNSKQEQRQREQLAQLQPRDTTAQQSAALQAALAASLRAANGRK